MEEKVRARETLGRWDIVSCALLDTFFLDFNLLLASFVVTSLFYVLSIFCTRSDPPLALTLTVTDYVPSFLILFKRELILQDKNFKVNLRYYESKTSFTHLCSHFTTQSVNSVRWDQRERAEFYASFIYPYSYAYMPCLTPTVLQQ